MSRTRRKVQYRVTTFQAVKPGLLKKHMRFPGTWKITLSSQLWKIHFIIVMKKICAEKMRAHAPYASWVRLCQWWCYHHSQETILPTISFYILVTQNVLLLRCEIEIYSHRITQMCISHNLAKLMMHHVFLLKSRFTWTLKASFSKIIVSFLSYVEKYFFFSTWK